VTRRNGARALVEALEKAGVETLFGYPGGTVTDVFDALGGSKLEFVLARHEQGAVHMADGYARVSGRPGVAVVTSGPGLTNTITALGAANMDGVPLVMISGQVPLDQIGTDAFQEADSTGITRAVTKHNFLVHSADEIPETVAEAFYIATHGKPGPVVIDVPKNVQIALTAAKYPERVCLRAYHPECAATTGEINRLAKLVNAAKRPLIYAGGGVIAADASKDVLALAEKAGIPVVTTLMGIGAIDEESPFALGMAGLHGRVAANRAVAKADLILALGVRFNDRITGRVSEFAKKAKIVHVDCDPSSINKNVRVHLGIVADVKDLLLTVDSKIVKGVARDWTADDFAEPEPGRGRAAANGIPPADALDAIEAVRRPGMTLVTDVGQHQMWAARYLVHREPRRFLTSGGMGAMGFGIPAAIGAAIADGEKRVIAILGDGGAQMTAQELVVAAERKLPVTFIVFNNRSLGMVRQLQDTYHGGRRFATEFASPYLPDFVKLAGAYGVKASRVGDAAGLAKTVARAVRARGPYLLEIAIDPAANVPVSAR